MTIQDVNEHVSQSGFGRERMLKPVRTNLKIHEDLIDDCKHYN